MKRTFLVDIIAYFFILLFLYTGVEKLADIHSFKDQLTGSPLLGSMAGIIAWGLPITEILLAIVLFLPGWQLRGLYAGLALMVIFTIYLGVILAIDNHISCSCGGIIENLSPRQHLWFNGAAIVLTALAIISARRQQISLRFRWFATTSSLILFISIGWIILTAFRAPVKTRSGLEGRLLPEFSMLLPDSLTRLNTADIPTGKPFIMVGFSPYCIHCQAEILDIVKHIRRFGDTTIYLVTSFPYSDMKKLYNAYHLAKYPNIVTAVDNKDIFLRYFKATAIPYAAIYDAKKRLKGVIVGQTNADLLSRSLDD
jgi:Methylamine utilisation protein MauE